jgi:hypothetical protein
LQVLAKCQNEVKTLIILKGRGLESKFSLDSKYINFGMIPEGTSNTNVIFLQNIGDFGAKYILLI